MLTIRKSFEFSAAHQLGHLVTVDSEHPCARLHGHNYTVTVEVQAADIDPQVQWVLDYRDLNCIKSWIDDTLDHRNLNDAMPPGLYSTAESLAAWLFDVATHLLTLNGSHAHAHKWRVTAVAVQETPKTWAEFRP